MLNIEYLKNQIIEELTTNQKIRLKIAIALISSPKFLILDISNYELDLTTKDNLQKYIINNKKDMIIILSSNNNKDIEILADRLAFINNDLIWSFLNVNKMKNLHYLLTIFKFDDLV
jgi:ABC-type multidrug transport system ATPase subunit